MTEDKLAVLGGKPTIEKSMKKYNSIGKEEVQAAQSVIESGVLSKFLGCWDPDFFGGPKVQEFEKAAREYFDVKHAVTVNSWTSGLVAAVGALEIEPGDEIIVSPWTMCASATAIVHWNAIPVFADIEPDMFCLDPRSVEKSISPSTKAIMAVDIFGQSCDIDGLMDIADRYNLKLITDTAQAPGTFYNGKHTGSIAHIGGYSLNYHKHIHTGEGGIIVTNDDLLAERLMLIRNHAEAVVQDKGVSNLSNMIGHNFRLGEIECAIGIEQLKKLNSLVISRQEAADKLTAGLKDLRGLTMPVVREKCSHAYYIYPLILDVEQLGVSRTVIFNALNAEGIEGLTQGYVNVHLLPMYQNKIAYGSKGFPWTIASRDISYAKGICPVAEELHDKTFLGYEMCLHQLEADDIELIVKAFQKVWKNLEKLK
jgi:perosamine synthetase